MADAPRWTKTPPKERAKFVFFDGMTWPLWDANLDWSLRYGTPTREDLLRAASIGAAYAALINCARARRKQVVREIRRAPYRIPEPEVSDAE